VISSCACWDALTEKIAWGLGDQFYTESKYTVAGLWCQLRGWFFGLTADYTRAGSSPSVPGRRSTRESKFHQAVSGMTTLIESADTSAKLRFAMSRRKIMQGEGNSSTMPSRSSSDAVYSVPCLTRCWSGTSWYVMWRLRTHKADRQRYKRSTPFADARISSLLSFSSWRT
jgi:hypothetical protein